MTHAVGCTGGEMNTILSKLNRMTETSIQLNEIDFTFKDTKECVLFVDSFKSTVDELHGNHRIPHNYGFDCKLDIFMSINLKN